MLRRAVAKDARLPQEAVAKGAKEFANEAVAEFETGC